MYQLIVSDFDGTLIDKEGRIPLSTILWFDQLRKKGIKIAIATGRCLKSVLDYNDDFIFCDYLITSNGAYIYDVLKEKVIFKKNIGIRTIKKIINIYQDEAIIYLTDHNIWNLMSKKSAYQDDFDVLRVKDQKKFLEENKSNIYKIELYFNTLKKAKESAKKIKEFGLKVNSNLQFNEGKYIVEITHLEVSKIEGVKKILRIEKQTLEDVISFGDGYNDIELLKESGLGVAVSNAIEEIKEVANDITLDNNSKGVENYLKKIWERKI